MMHINRQKVTGIVSILCYLAAGVLLIVKPELTLDLSVWLLVGLLAVMSVIWLIRYFRSSPEEGAGSFDLAEALLAVSAAAVVALRRDLFSTLLPMLWACFLIVGGYLIFQAAIDFLRLKYVRWWILLIGSFLMIGLGVLALFSPAFLEGHMPLFFGISLLFAAALNIYSLVLNFMLGKGHLPKPRKKIPIVNHIPETPVPPADEPDAPATVMEELAQMAKKEAAPAEETKTEG